MSRRGPIPGTTGRDKAAIAVVACAAHAAGESMGHTVAEHFGITYAAARQAVTNARKAGHDIPRGTARRPSVRQVARNDTAARNATARIDGLYGTLGPRSAAGAVRCSCGQECKSRTALGAHTWAAHSRPPTDAERIILAAKVAA